MATYFIESRAQSNGDHEVHVETCPNLPGDLDFLGNFTSCQMALKAARYFYKQANGCAVCCRRCHTK